MCLKNNIRVLLVHRLHRYTVYDHLHDNIVILYNTFAMVTDRMKLFTVHFASASIEFSL